VRRRKEGKWRRGEDVDDKKVVFKKKSIPGCGQMQRFGPLVVQSRYMPEQGVPSCGKEACPF
jgi:hypothetical protein